MQTDPEDPRWRLLVDRPADPEGEYVLYWMTGARRAAWNFALDRALEWARELGRPLLVLEALRTGYRWASRRHHRFILDGMADNARAFADAGVRHYAYVEPEAGEGSGLFAALAEDAAVVVADDSPVFFLPRMLAAAASRCSTRMEAVDSVGMLPLRVKLDAHKTAHAFRRILQKSLPDHLMDWPARDPLADYDLGKATVPRSTYERWRDRTVAELESDLQDELPVDDGVAPVATRGGSVSGAERASVFLDGLGDYAEARNEPAAEATSRLSAHLHYGHVSPHQVFAALVDREGWNPGHLGEETKGSRTGWWGMSEAAESFLDELVTWRELGQRFVLARDDHDQYDSLPDWARRTLDTHRGDERPHVYGLAEFEQAATHDEVWNAAQRQLLREGRIHNYMRMLWGKKILHWTASPEDALETMLALNDKYALDGRDPNSISGVFWVLGRHDRAWGPEREVFGKIRYMTCASARRKFDLDPYLERYAEAPRD